MSNMLSEFEAYKQRIPQFIIKLYHILEQKEYSDYLAWHLDTEIYIKNVKKLEEKVLPHYFRHKKMSSFVRQLNMYRFSKVNKPIKERNTMYFKNESFQRGNIKSLTKIKRNHRRSKEELEDESDKQDNISPNQELEANTALKDYKNQVKNAVGEMVTILKRLEHAHPEIKAELRQAVFKCNEMLQIPAEGGLNNSVVSLDECLQNKNMMSTMRLLPPVQPVLFASQCSFFHIN